MNEKEMSKYVVDTKQTFFANIFFVIFLVAVIVIIDIFAGKIMLLNEETNKLLGMLVLMFVTIKMLIMVGPPNLHYKRRENK